MDSEQENYLSPQSTTHETNTQSYETTSQPYEQPTADQANQPEPEAQAAETSKEEAASATRRRRRRPPRGGSRRAQAGPNDTQTDEPETEAGEHEGRSASPTLIGEETQEHPPTWAN